MQDWYIIAKSRSKRIGDIDAIAAGNEKPIEMIFKAFWKVIFPIGDPVVMFQGGDAVLRKVSDLFLYKTLIGTRRMAMADQ